MVLWEKESVNVGQLGEILSLDAGTLTPLLKRLEKEKRKQEKKLLKEKKRAEKKARKEQKRKEKEARKAQKLKEKQAKANS